MHILFASTYSATHSGTFIVLDHDYHTEIHPRAGKLGEQEEVQRLLCGSVCAYLKAPVRESQLGCQSETNSAPTGAEWTRHQLVVRCGTKPAPARRGADQHHLDRYQTPNELSTSSTRGRNQHQLDCHQTRSGSPTNSTGKPPSSLPEDPAIHLPQLLFLARSFGQGARYANTP